MSNRIKSIILIIAGLQLLLVVGLLALPTVVGAIPGRYRVWLQENHTALSSLAEGVIDQVAPVATALPAPVASASDRVDLTTLISSAQAEGVTSAGASSSETDLAVIGEVVGAQDSGQAADVAVAPVVETSTPEPEPTVEAAVPEPTAEPTLEPTVAPTATPEPLPSRAIIPNVGVVRQSFNNCGPANLTQVLNWYGSDITQEDVASYLKPNPEDRNVSPWQIADYVNEFTPGFQAIARSGGDMEMLKKFLAAGFPVVIEKGYVLEESGWWGHYLTLYGYDDALEEIYSQDSYLGPFDGSGRVDSYDEFSTFWQQFNNTFYVVYTPDQEAEVQAILGEDMYDDFKMWQKVAAVAEEETRARPDDAFAWFNLGTALTRMGGLTGEARYYEGGAQAFDRAREIGLPPRMLWYQFQPYLAYIKLERYQDVIDLADATLETQGGRNVEETFWYKGHALAYLGDVNGAIDAYRQSLTVNENFYPAQISLDSLGAGG